MSKSTRVCLVFGLLAAGLSAGCKGVSRERYSQVTVGMTRAEVEGILGKGTEVPASEVSMSPFLEPRLGPPGPGESPEMTTTQKGLPPLKDLKEKTTWVQWGEGKRFILVGFIDDKVAVKTAKIPAH